MFSCIALTDNLPKARIYFVASYTLKRKEGRIVYSPSIVVKVISLLFAILLLLGFIGSISSGFELTMLIPLFLCLVLFIIPFYKDAWVFDNSAHAVMITYGFGPFSKSKTFKYSEIVRLDIHHFHKGIAEDNTAIKPNWRHKEMVSLRLITKKEEDKALNIEVLPAKRNGLRLETLARDISSFTGFDLFIDYETLSPGLRGKR